VDRRTRTLYDYYSLPYIGGADAQTLGLRPIGNRKGKYKRLRDEMSVGIHIRRKIIERWEEFLQV